MTYYSANCAVIAEYDDLSDENLVPLVPKRIRGTRKSEGQDRIGHLYKRAKPNTQMHWGFQDSEISSLTQIAGQEERLKQIIRI